MHSILNSAFYVYVLGGIDMTIPELEQYLSSIFPHVEKPVFLPLGGAADESLLTNLSNSSPFYFDRAFGTDYRTIENFLCNEYSDHSNFLIHIHSRYNSSSGHSHDYFEMIYVRAGSATYHVGEDIIDMEAGDFLLIAPGVYHSLDAHGAKDVVISFVFCRGYFDPPALNLISKNQLFYEFISERVSERVSERISDPVPDEPSCNLYIRAGENSEVLNTADKLLCEYLDPDSCSEGMLKCLFPSMLNQLFRIWKKSDGTIDFRKEIEDSDVQQILRYIETNYAAASLKEAAVRFGYHPDHLSRLLKRRLGHTFSEIKHQICVDKAKFLLLGSDLTIQQVAEHVGFSNMSFFYEIFDRYCGTTPARYREDFGQVKLKL